jgi:hypothetical protein
MAAGQGFKTFATGDVLTAADTNGYLMQGVWVFANAAARSAAVTSPQEGNMSYLSDTNSTEYYSGSAWVAVGAASSGGMTVLASGSLSSTALVLNSISGSYNNLQLVLRDFYPSLAAGISMTVNSITDYNIIRTKLVANTTTQDSYTGNTAFSLTYDNNINTADNNSSAIIDISDYASSVNKNIRSTVSYTNSTPAKVYNTVIGNAVMSAAITSINVNLSNGTFSGGTYILYGVK